MKEFKVGDRVYHRKEGMGIVYRIYENDIMSTAVRFSNGNIEFFSKEGSGIYGDSPRIVHATTEQALAQVEKEIDKKKDALLKLEQESIALRRQMLKVCK